jgi:hypothetical protein
MPSIAALMKLTNYLDKNHRFYAFFDLHATIAVTNSFVYANDHFEVE